MSKLHLGLIGDNIAASRSPLLHRLAGAQNHIDVQYDRLIPKALEMDFDAVFDTCQTGDYRGINITYPYKERVLEKLTTIDPVTRAMGASNLVLFNADGAEGFNTDYTGFVSAYRHIRQDKAPGRTLMIGTGGVGRAIAFGLLELGVQELRLFDQDRAKAEKMKADLQNFADINVQVFDNLPAAAQDAQGVINSTPVGMVGYEGTPIAPEDMKNASWVFDAVYTPANTLFLQNASQIGAEIISGWELYFYQGVHAWRLFSGLDVDEVALRRSLLEDETA